MARTNRKKAAVAVVRDRLKSLREQMAQHRIDAYLIPGTDPHQSEYVPTFWNRRAWISGFDGSMGDVVVTRNRAGLWVDGRYHLQAAAQLAGGPIELFQLGQPRVPTLVQWLAQTLKSGHVCGADPRLISRTMLNRLHAACSAKGAKLALIEENLVDIVWHDRPAWPDDPIRAHPLRHAGERHTSKLRRVRAEMRKRGADVHVTSALDTIAWLLNLRGNDIPFNPVMLGHLVITARQVVLFCHLDRVPPGVRRALGRGVSLRPYEAFGSALQQLACTAAAPPSTVWVDGRSASAWVIRKLGRCKLITDPSPAGRMKARKNATEVLGIRTAHRRDGVALVRFLRWLHETVPRGGVTEIGASEHLAALRAQGAHYRGPSFATIAGLGPHGAIVHYQATPQSDAILRPGRLFLVDSGAQYLDGTTDVTRTVLLGGRVTARQRDEFTRVLKAHIALARARFPQGTTGRQLDTLARRHLWDAGLDYAHGTGHGVGAYLSVHEGPQSISPRGTDVPLEPGNVLSNEPGYYREGHYGIRTENLLLVASDPRGARATRPFLRFEVLTLCPIDTRLVDRRLLDRDERAWLDAYHRWVRRELTPVLPDLQDRTWLRKATAPV